MSFAHPWLVVVAIAIAAIFYATYRAFERRRSAISFAYSNLAFMTGALRSRTWPARLLNAGWCLAVLLLVGGLAGPRVRAYVPERDGAVILCVDTSGSMAASDVLPTRAQAAAAAMRAFVNATPQGTSIGIIAFAGGADVLTLPTRDRVQVQTALNAIPDPNGGTAIGDALQLALRSLPPAGHRVVVLITDGVNNTGGDPLAAAQALGRHRVSLYTVGIGTNSGALIPGTLQTAGIDEEALRAYAAATGGAYSRANDADQLREALARLSRTTTFVRKNVDLSLPSAVAGAALMVVVFLSGFAAGRYP